MPLAGSAPDSSEDAESREPLLHRDAYVLEFPVSALPSATEIEAETGTGIYEFRPAHMPYEDNYAHSEINALKNGVVIDKENRFKNTADKKAKQLLLSLLAIRARICLKPRQIDRDES